MSTLEVSNLNDGTTTVATTFVTGGSAKVFAHWDASSGTPSLKDNLNTSSITDDNTGDFRVNFTSSMNTSTYSQYGSAGGTGGANGDESFIAFQTSSGGTASQSNKLRCRRGSGNNLGSLDAVLVTYLAHGDLA